MSSIVAGVLAMLLRTLSAIVASTADIQRATAAVVVCTDAIVRACAEVEPLARDIRLDVEATRESVKQPLAKTTVVEGTNDARSAIEAAMRAAVAKTDGDDEAAAASRP